MKSINYNLYEINTRVWINRFSKQGQQLNLTQIPDDYWRNLKNMGMDYIWLMGVWKTNPDIVKKYCFEDDLVREYDRALPDWREDDVIGSPYAIDVYELNPRLGDGDELIKLKKKLNSFGLKLILDFVANHFSAESSLLKTNPEIFLPVPEELYLRDKFTYFKPEGLSSYFSHGRDPFFPAWQDTVQVNHCSAKAHKYLADQLLKMTDLCDGVRCDMAMLALSKVFRNTWGNVLSYNKCEKPETEFWESTIRLVKQKCGDFLFIAEAYWDLEWQLQTLGFDYTYDKSLYDRLKTNSAEIVRDHLKAENDFQKKSVRFIENHDEDRVLKTFGPEKSMASAVIASTSYGLHLFHDGQFEGKRVKLPVQLGREPIESEKRNIKSFYANLLEIVSKDIIKYGNWELLICNPTADNDQTNNNLIAWQWMYKNERLLVVTNFSNTRSRCRMFLDIEIPDNEISFVDLLNETKYIRYKSEIDEAGLYIELLPYKSHIFYF